MKKIISLIFVALLITSCGKAPESEVDTLDDVNVDVNVEVPAEENPSIDVPAEEIPTAEDSTGGVSVTTDENSKDEDKLVDDAISEIDDIINEVEVDVK